MVDFNKLARDKMPHHIGIILDGNGRWAQKRGLNRSAGHRAGGETLDRLLDKFLELNIKNVSLYTFSAENWKRPKSEIAAIWSLMEEFFKTRLDRCREKGVKIKTSGNLEELPVRVQKIINEVVEMTANEKKLTANFCINYGSHDEIVRAFNNILAEKFKKITENKKYRSLKPIKKKDIEKHLFTHPMPPVDLLLRPGGEKRISNFLLWQIAYAELYFTDTLWPDFNEEELYSSLSWFQSRKRRFGGL